MKTLQFTIKIEASPETVWKGLFEPDNYTAWTSIFTKGSYYKTDSFSEGSRIHILSPAGDGMYSVLDRIEENSYLAFRHLGLVSNFEEQPLDEATKSWTNSLETYRLTAVEGGTHLEVNVDTAEEYMDYMKEKFPSALAELKKLSEKISSAETCLKEKNPVNWFEIYVDDIVRARKFYETMLGKEMIDLPMPEGMDDKMVAFPWAQGGVNATGALVQSKMLAAGGNSTLVYFQTEECLAEQNRVEGAGGKVIQPKFSIGEHGFCSLCMDTEGNMFGLHSMK